MTGGCPPPQAPNKHSLFITPYIVACAMYIIRMRVQKEQKTRLENWPRPAWLSDDTPVWKL
jgi:hypothetical protein